MSDLNFVVCGVDGCKTSLKSEYFKQAHIKKVHRQNLEKNEKCRFCDQKFLTKGTLKRHVTINHKKGPKNKDSISKPTLKKGKILKNDKKKVASISSEFVDKTNSNNINSVKCSICEARFDSGSPYNKKVALSLHNRKTHEACDVCRKAFSAKTALNKHKKKIHESSELATENCDICFKSFSSKDALTAHRKTDHDLLKSSKGEEDLSHIDDDEKEDTVKDENNMGASPSLKLKCKGDQKKISTKISDNKEEISPKRKNKSEEKAIKCEYCGDTFEGTRALVRHMNKHDIKAKDKRKNSVLKTNRISSPKISSSKKSILSKDKYKDLIESQKTSGEYKCEFCDKVFQGYRSLFRHTKVHSVKNKIG